MIDYKYNENGALAEIKEYIDSTYNQHYSGKYQATDMIIDSGHGTGFCVGNIMKYAKRYGKKDGYNKKDLLKIIHYAIIQLYVHESKNVLLSTTKEKEVKPQTPTLTPYNIPCNTIPTSFIASCYKGNIIPTPDSMCHACDCWKIKELMKTYTT